VLIDFWWGKFKEKPLERLRRRWEDDIKTDLYKLDVVGRELD
jgi:hypothetical protein